jgi:hypothetical protein
VGEQLVDLAHDAMMAPMPILALNRFAAAVD